MNVNTRDSECCFPGPRRPLQIIHVKSCACAGRDRFCYSVLPRAFHRGSVENLGSTHRPLLKIILRGGSKKLAQPPSRKASPSSVIKFWQQRLQVTSTARLERIKPTFVIMFTKRGQSQASGRQSHSDSTRAVTGVCYGAPLSLM